MTDSTCLLGPVGMCVKSQPIQHWWGVIWVTAELSWWVSGHLGIELDDDTETLQANMPPSTIYQHGIHGMLWIYMISYFVLPWVCLAVVPQVENDWDWTLVVLETLQAFQSQQFETGFEVVPEAELPDANVKQDAARHSWVMTEWCKICIFITLESTILTTTHILETTKKHTRRPCI